MHYCYIVVMSSVLDTPVLYHRGKNITINCAYRNIYIKHGSLQVRYCVGDIHVQGQCKSFIPSYHYWIYYISIFSIYLKINCKIVTNVVIKCHNAPRAQIRLAPSPIGGGSKDICTCVNKVQSLKGKLSRCLRRSQLALHAGRKTETRKRKTGSVQLL